MASGFWTGAERATGNLAQTGMQLLNYQANERQRDTANAMLERRVNLAEEQGAREQRAFEVDEATRKEGETPIAVEGIANMFEGGRQGPMFKMVYDHTLRNGFIDTSSGGLGTFKKKDRDAMLKLLSEPGFASRLSRTRISYWRTGLNNIDNMLSQKPGDKKLMAERQKFVTGLNQSLGQDKALQDELGRQDDLVTSSNKNATYKQLGGNLYMIQGSKSTLIQQGSLEDKAFHLASRDDNWGYSEPENFELVQSYKRLLQGNPQSTEPDPEREMAQEAIDAGADPEQVKSMYKQRTGKDF